MSFRKESPNFEEKFAQRLKDTRGVLQTVELQVTRLKLLNLWFLVAIGIMFFSFNMNFMEFSGFPWLTRVWMSLDVNSRTSMRMEEDLVHPKLDEEQNQRVMCAGKRSRFSSL